MDATNTERAGVALSWAAKWALLTRCRACGSGRWSRLHRPFRSAHSASSRTAHLLHSFDKVLATDEGWAKYNRHYWTKDYQGFLEFFFAKCFTEPHSTKQIEDCVGWALETTPEVLLAPKIAPTGINLQ